MKIAFFGSSLLSSYWNGAATYYRGLLRALSAHGHDITFFEPDAHDRQKNRDIDPPDWCSVVVYEATPQGAREATAEAARADCVIVTSGIGYEDTMVRRLAFGAARPDALRLYWDVDAPATLAELASDVDHPLRSDLANVDLVLTYGGGDPVIYGYRGFGAADCVPIYNALDPSTHHPVAPQQEFNADLSFLGNRLPDREHRVHEFFLAAAAMLPARRFLLGGSGWEQAKLPQNVRAMGHVPTRDHNAFNVSPTAVLNISRDSMASNGFSPATRVFEAAGAAACLITDEWPGLDLFLKPGEEVLVARDGKDVAQLVETLSRDQARRIGERARQRVLRDHTYDRRAQDVDKLLRRLSIHGRLEVVE